jgi:hypothetical protein
MMMPSIVKIDRNVLAAKARSADLMAVRKFIATHPPPSNHP